MGYFKKMRMKDQEQSVGYVTLSEDEELAYQKFEVRWGTKPRLYHYIGKRHVILGPIPGLILSE